MQWKYLLDFAIYTTGSNWPSSRMSNLSELCLRWRYKTLTLTLSSALATHIAALLGLQLMLMGVDLPQFQKRRRVIVFIYIISCAWWEWHFRRFRAEVKIHGEIKACWLLLWVAPSGVPTTLTRNPTAALLRFACEWCHAGFLRCCFAFLPLTCWFVGEDLTATSANSPSFHGNTGVMASCRLMQVYMLNYCTSKTGASTIYTVFDLGNKLMRQKLSLPAFFFTSSSVLFPVAASAFMGSAAVDSRTVQEIVWTVACVCGTSRLCLIEFLKHDTNYANPILQRML